MDCAVRPNIVLHFNLFVKPIFLFAVDVRKEPALYREARDPPRKRGVVGIESHSLRHEKSHFCLLTKVTFFNDIRSFRNGRYIIEKDKIL